MQIDLQEPLVVDSMLQDGHTLTFRRDGNAFFVALTEPQTIGTQKTIAVYYHGKPPAAKRPPWDGGLIWQRDSLGNRWIATAVEGLGASLVAEQGFVGRRAGQPTRGDHSSRLDD